MLSDKNNLSPRFLDKSEHLNTAKRAELFSDKDFSLKNNLLKITPDPNSFTEMLPRQSSVNSQMNQLFKNPNFADLPIKKANVKSLNSPRRRVYNGRVRNDLKLSQQSKISLIPRPSFIKSRKSLHGSRISQLNARKELIKKMVFLAECSLKENGEVKQSTPVKMLAGLTPKKTPRSIGYFILPEFSKKLPKLEDIRSPIQDLVKKEMFAYSSKSSDVLAESDKLPPVVKNEANESNFIVECKSGIKSEVTNFRGSSSSSRFRDILFHCEMFSVEVTKIHQKIKFLDESFENKLNNIPDYRVYNEFCIYQSKKEDHYKKLNSLEMDLRNFVSAQTNMGNKLKAYMKTKQELFEKQLNVHKEFELAVKSALQACDQEKSQMKLIGEVKPKVETPKLRRSLRLSKLKKTKSEEKSPMTRKLKKLNIKSKEIQRSGKV